MTVSVLLITHEDIGTAMISAASTMLGELPLPTTAASVDYSMDPDDLTQRLTRLIAQIEQGDGILILSDLFGATPCNIAQKLKKQHQSIQIVTGLNLSMLVRVMNYPDLPLPEMAEKAISGGHAGVLDCKES